MKYLSLFSGYGEAKKLYESGMTIVEVAKEMATTPKIIYGAFKRNGFQCRPARKRNQHGKNNDSWTGDNASYAALHYRVYNAKGKPLRCDVCGHDKDDRRYQWASLNGNYTDIEDYKRMCESCHAKYDNKINNITK